MSGVVSFSVEARTWTYTCAWGCYGFDFEGEQEAIEALARHRCEKGA